MPDAPRLLVIDDDPATCRLIGAIFGAEGVVVSSCADGEAGLDRIGSEPSDVVLLDLVLPGLSGLEVLEQLRSRAPSLPVVMLTAEHDVQTAIRAIRLGAYDYLTKPVEADQIVAVVRRAIETRALRVEVEDLRRQLSAGGELTQRMGPSAAVREVVEQVAIVAASRFTVLVLGETGTGKDLVAQAIHRASERRDRPFVALDCGAIPEPLLESELFGYERGAFTGADRRKQGQFQLAESGTLFLDEIGNLPAGLQAKLLRVLESQQVVAVGATRATPLDVRFIAATNDDLQARIQGGRFRADLFFRLAQYTIKLSPLRERPSDIGYLAQRFVHEASVELRRPVQQIDAAALAVLERHAWPGNVRELRNVVRQAVLRSTGVVLGRDAFRDLVGRKVTAGDGPSGEASLRGIGVAALRTAERAAIEGALRAARGNKSRAARALQTDYKTLHTKMKSLGIRARDFLPD